MERTGERNDKILKGRGPHKRLKETHKMDK